MGLTDENAELLTILTEEEKVKLIEGLVLTLGDLSQIHLQVEQFALDETAVKDCNAGCNSARYGLGTRNNFISNRAHPLRAKLLEPIRESARVGFAVLDKISLPIARQIVIESANAINGVGLSLLQGHPYGVEHSYFREWLAQMRNKFAAVDALTFPANFDDLKKLKMRKEGQGGTPLRGWGLKER